MSGQTLLRLASIFFLIFNKDYFTSKTLSRCPLLPRYITRVQSLHLKPRAPDYILTILLQYICTSYLYWVYNVLYCALSNIPTRSILYKLDRHSMKLLIRRRIGRDVTLFFKYIIKTWYLVKTAEIALKLHWIVLLL